MQVNFICLLFYRPKYWNWWGRSDKADDFGTFYGQTEELSTERNRFIEISLITQILSSISVRLTVK